MTEISSLLELATARLTTVLGADEARSVIRACVAESGCSTVATREDLLAVAHALVRRRGFIEVVGRSLKVSVLLLTK